MIAEGFYQQMPGGEGLEVHFVRRDHDQLLALAGLAESRNRDGRLIETCALITKADSIAGIDDRMPAVLDAHDYDLWLEPTYHAEKELLAMLRPYSGHGLVAYQVSNRIETTTGDEPDFIIPA